MTTIDPTTQLTDEQFHKAGEILTNGMIIGQDGDQVRALLRQNIFDEETVARLNKHTGRDLPADTYASGLMLAFCRALDPHGELRALIKVLAAIVEPKPRHYV